MMECVLLVDDDPSFLDVYQVLLSQYFQVQTAGNAEQALALVRNRGPFAVVISDKNMPGMDGISFLERLGTISPRTVKIMLTGQPDLETAMAAVNVSGVFGFFVKGCAPEDLVEKVRAAMAEYRRRNRGETVPASEVLTKEEKEFFFKKD